MGFGSERRSAEQTSGNSSSTGSASEQERGPAAAGGFQAGLDANSPKASSGESDPAMVQLVGEMEKLSARNAWSGVEISYQRMKGLDSEISGHCHHLGALAAKTTGDVRAWQMRLRKAEAAGVDVSEAGEVRGGLEGIDDQFVRVFIQTATERPKSDKKAEKIGGPVLTIKSMPFAPDQANAVKFAQKEFSERWVFEGMLAHGDYTLEHEGRTRPFEVASYSSDVQETV